MTNNPVPVNPQGFTNQANINTVFGQSVPGTYNRSIGVDPVITDPLTGEALPAMPTADQPNTEII